jgi:MoaA/NifB/PqqE/SkfB family radical SAM enzyme
VQEVSEICELLKEAGVVSVKLSGGEPTVRDDLPQIIQAAAASGLSVTVITNGIRLRDEVLHTLRGTGGKLKVSVHFADERNDGVLGRKSFDKVIRNVRRALELGVPLGFNTVVYRGNVASMASVAALALSIGVPKVTYFTVVSRGAAVNIDFSEELGHRFRTEVEAEADQIREAFPTLRIRVIDIAKEDYWIVDHDGKLFISGGEESEDRILHETKEWAIPND